MKFQQTLGNLARPQSSISLLLISLLILTREGRLWGARRVIGTKKIKRTRTIFRLIAQLFEPRSASRFSLSFSSFPSPRAPLGRASLVPRASLASLQQRRQRTSQLGNRK